MSTRMWRSRVRLALGVIAATVAFEAAASISTAAHSGQWWDDQARVLAGLSVVSPGRASLAASPAMAKHATAMTQAWDAFTAKRLAPAQKFSAAALARYEAARGPVFYPFGGPDAAWPLTLFPDAMQFALVGLEPVGNIVDVAGQPEEERERALEQVRRSLHSALRLSFFKTNDMQAELPRNRMSGVLPLLLTLVARQGFAIESVTLVSLDPEGRVVAATDTSAPGGVRINFRRSPAGPVRSLFYLRADLSNAGLASAPHVARWIQAYPAEATLLKAASYLLHSDHFSIIRERITTRSALVLQDDSGVPFRHFAQAEWATSLFGTYDGPIPLFAKRFQSDLRDAYGTQAQPLDFGIGYDHRSRTSNLQLHVRQGGGALASSRSR